MQTTSFKNPITEPRKLEILKRARNVALSNLKAAVAHLEQNGTFPADVYSASMCAAEALEQINILQDRLGVRNYFSNITK